MTGKLAGREGGDLCWDGRPLGGDLDEGYEGDACKGEWRGIHPKEEAKWLGFGEVFFLLERCGGDGNLFLLWEFKESTGVIGREEDESGANLGADSILKEKVLTIHYKVI